MEYFETELHPERALLLGVDTGEYDCEASLAELWRLAQTAGAEPVGVLSQKLDNPNPATYIGSGRLAELVDFCAQQAVDLVIADGELSPAQQRNLERAANTRVIDRTTLILDIFAQRANSSEGKIQVELAQLQYALPRLGGRGKAMSRLGGGIGTRGPGETKLESDRRHIHRRIHALRVSLLQIEKRRNALRARRKKDGVTTVAIVGYTNAGKSTLLNALTQAGVLAEDKLFATLDPTARRLALPSGRTVMLVDTVGLVRRLPHRLIEAFHSTLEEAKAADLLLHVCDASDPAYAEHLAVTAQLMEELGCAQTPTVTVMNKCDCIPSESVLPMPGKTVAISAKTGAGLPELLSAIESALQTKTAQVTLLVPYTAGHILGDIRQNGQVLSEEFLPEGTKVQVLADSRCLERWKAYIQ